MALNSYILSHFFLVRKQEARYNIRYYTNFTFHFASKEGSHMKDKKALFILIPFLLFVIIVGALAIVGDRIPDNPPETVGNTAGNLNNSGYFCEYDGTVYFANAYDSNTLYSMDPSEQNIKKLGNASVENILAGGKFLYYYQTGVSGDAGIGALRSARSFNRCKLNGTDVTGLTRDPIVSAQLVGSNLYIMTVGDNGPLFYRMKIDKSDKTDLADYEINPACAVNGTIYYNGTQENHYLYALNTSTDSISTLWDGNLWYPIAQGDYIYYMDVENNYRLCRYSLSRNEVEVLTEERIDCFNVGYGYVYYQVNGEEACLKCMRDDGSDSWVIAEGNYTAIHMTSQYVYFQMFGETSTWYHSPLGTWTYSSFDGAREAALDVLKK